MENNLYPTVVNFFGCQWFTQLFEEGPGRPNRIVVSVSFNFFDGKKCFILFFSQMTFMFTRPGEAMLPVDEAQSIRFNGELK